MLDPEGLLTPDPRGGLSCLGRGSKFSWDGTLGGGTDGATLVGSSTVAGMTASSCLTASNCRGVGAARGSLSRVSGPRCRATPLPRDLIGNSSSAVEIGMGADILPRIDEVVLERERVEGFRPAPLNFFIV